MKSRLSTILLGLCIASSTLAQQGQLKGLVLNGEGQPVPFVSVYLKENKKGATSNEKGQFVFASLPADTYTLVASFVGYKTLEQAIKVEDNKTLNISLELFENAETLREIVVKGYVSQNEKMVSVGKVAIRPLDLPQSVMTIDRQVLDSQQALRLSDVLMNTNGVYISGTTGGYQEEISARGFSLASTNTFRNGVRYFNGMMMELSGLERVEIMKGSTAILFGNVAAGGIINLVTKKPKFDFGGEVSLRTGSFGLWKPTFDVFGGIGKGQKVAFRLNGSYEKANSFRVGVSSERVYVNPSVLVNLGKKTEVIVEGDYANDTRTPDFGVGIINYQLVDIPREEFLGVPWSYYKAKQASATATVTHRFNDNWKLTFTGAYRNYTTALFSNTRPNSGTLITAAGLWIRNIQRSEVASDYYLGQLDLTGTFKTGRLGHQVLVGMDTDSFETLTTAYNQLARYDTVNVFGTRQYRVRTDIPTLTLNTLTTAPVSRVGAYAQDLITLSPQLKALVGLRYSYMQTLSDVLTYATNKTVSSSNFDAALSPRLGLVYQPSKNNSVFASYANSFTLNTGVDVEGNTLPPSLIDQYEIGVKNELMNGRVSANITAYRILNSNLAQISLANGNTNTNIKELAGSVQSDGVEIDLAARPVAGLMLMAGYSYNETQYVQSNTFVEGSLLRYNPNHTANASLSYKFETGKFKNLQMGLAGVYIGDRFAGRSTRVQVANDAYRLVALPAYTQIDATFGYQLGNVNIRGKVGNILDKTSYNVHDDNSINPIVPRNFSLSVGCRF